MINLRSIIAVAAIFLLHYPLFSQIDLSSPAPFDTAVRTGRLENGLTYFIRHNREPEKRASFWFIQNVGAILEDDDQDGLAHFLEHMALNGTEHFPGKTIINTLERHGVAFGNNINAYTAQDETVYNISDVPVDPPGLMDTCLLIMYDWSDYISLTDKEIEAERGVIREEWRSGRDADFRMMEKYLPVIMKDSRYAERNVIGDIDVINNFKSNRLREFYGKWYRPDLQAVAIAGDFNVDDMEKKVKELFSKLKPADNPGQRPVFTVPFHKETLFVLATDKEASQASVAVYIKHKGTVPTDKNLAYMKEQFMVSLMKSMMDSRINELLQKGTPPFINGSVAYSELVRGTDGLNIVATANRNLEDVALNVIYTEAERAARSGFTRGELERAKADLLTAYENFYREKDKIPNDSYLSYIQEYFLTNEPLTSVGFEYELACKVIPLITPEEVTGMLRKFLSDENRVIVIRGQEGEGIKHLSEGEALEIIRKVKESVIAPYHDSETGKSLISEILPGSKIIKTVNLGRFEAVEWTLSNNARVVYRKADFEKDEIILSAYSKGGSSLYETDMLPSATMLPYVIGMYGLGDFDNITLQKMMAGKKASASVSLGQLTEGINGYSTPADFETMMKLVYLHFSKPRFDSEAHDAIIARYASYLGSMEKDPSKIMQDSISLFLTDFNHRTVLLNNEMLSKVDFEMIKRIYNERFGSASDFIFFIVGNINEDTLRPLVEKYIGSINGGGKKEKFIDRMIRHPEGKFNREVHIPLAVPKSTVFISYSADFNYNSFNNVCLKVINGILEIVFTEKLREETGGTYGVSVNLSSQLNPYSNVSALIMFDCDPEKAGRLKEIVYSEIGRMVRSGPSEENLRKSVSNMLKIREESKLHNIYWSNALYSYYYTGIDVNDPKNYEDILKKLTVKDLQKVAKAFFGKADVADVVFLPEK